MECKTCGGKGMINVEDEIGEYHGEMYYNHYEVPCCECLLELICPKCGGELKADIVDDCLVECICNNCDYIFRGVYVLWIKRKRAALSANK